MALEMELSDLDGNCDQYQHEGGTGKCIMPDDICHGMEPCLEFRK